MLQRITPRGLGWETFSLGKGMMVISVQSSYWDCCLIHAFEVGFRRSEHFTLGPHQVTDSFHHCEAQGSDKAVPKAWQWHRKGTKAPVSALELGCHQYPLCSMQHNKISISKAESKSEDRDKWCHERPPRVSQILVMGH